MATGGSQAAPSRAREYFLGLDSASGTITFLD